MIKNVSIIGFGKLGLLHACLSNIFNKSKVVNIVESNFFLRMLLSIFLKKINILKKINKNLVKNSDLIIIATPPNTTPAILKKLKYHKFKKSILIEKPGFTNLEKFKDNIKILDSFDYVQFGFMYRYKKTFYYAKKLLKKNNFGQIKKVDCYAYVNQPIIENQGWRSDPKKSGGGSLIVQGIHLIDILFYYFKDINIKSKKIKYYKSTKIDLETTINCYNENIKNILIKTSIIKKNFRKLELKIKIYYQNALLEIDDDKIIIESNKKKKIIYYFDLFKSSFYEIGDQSFSNQYEEFFYKNLSSKLNISHYEKVIKFISLIYEKRN